ncbi:MAG: thiamine-phosphate kinase [Pirellulaceae bacterium]
MENEFIGWLRSELVTTSAKDSPVSVSIGDDAAVLRPLPNGMVVTTDLLSDGLHFELDRHGAFLAGRKSLAVNLSDIAAMACRPAGAVVSLLLPKIDAKAIAIECMRGIQALASEFACPIIGGDTNVGGQQLVISVTAFGIPLSDRAPLLRSTARAGDWILVTGPLGGSILGHHLNFVPRVREAETLHSRFQLTAGMDISDGLALDLSRLAEASGVGAELWLENVPISDDANLLSQRSGKPALQHALGDGEDFELLLTASPSDAEQIMRTQPLDSPIYHVGMMFAESGLFAVDANGIRRNLAPTGFQHGATS